MYIFYMFRECTEKENVKIIKYLKNVNIRRLLELTGPVITGA
jgi:hypothetical protein